MSFFFIKHPGESDLALFAGGELGPLARWRIERHLHRCERCQEAVADFFHLQSDLAELAELPALDWQALTHQIKVAAAQTEVQESPAGWLQGHAAWKLGFVPATALCVLIVYQQFPANETALDSPVFSDAVQEKFAEPAGADQISTQPSAPEPGEQEAAENALTDSETSFEKNESLTAASSRKRVVGQDSESATEGKIRALKTDRVGPKDSPRGGRRDLARSLGAATRKGRDSRATAKLRSNDSDEEAGREQQSQAPALRAAAPARAGEVSSHRVSAPEDNARLQEFDAVSSSYRSPPTSARSEVAQLRAGGEAGARTAEDLERTEEARKKSPASATEAVLEARLGEQETRTGQVSRQLLDAPGQHVPGSREGEPAGFTFLPAAFEGTDAEVGVAADGSMTIRTLDSKTSTITITNVYLP